MRLKAHLLAQPARPDGRDTAKITGRFRAARHYDGVRPPRSGHATGLSTASHQHPGPHDQLRHPQWTTSLQSIHSF